MKGNGTVEVDPLVVATNTMGGLGLTPMVSSQSIDDLTFGAGKSYANEVLKRLSNDEVVKAFMQAPIHSKIIFLNEIKKRGVQIIMDLDVSSTRKDAADFLKDEQFVFVDGMMDKENVEQIEMMITMSDYHMSPIKGRDVDHEKAAILLDGCRKLFKKQKPKKFYQELNKWHQNNRR